MRKWKIIEIDKDYHGHYTRCFLMEFASLEEAQEWCRTNSPIGCDYLVDKEWSETTPTRIQGEYRHTIIDEYMKKGKR